MRTLCLLNLLVAVSFALLACSTRSPETTTETVPEAAESPKPAADTVTQPEIDRWREPVMAAVADYTRYSKVADYPKWAPTMCAAPRPRVQFMSEATGGRAHGQKLCFLWVKDLGTYAPQGAAAETPQPAGQVIVKETFHPVEGAGGIEANGKEYKPGDRGPLFVMLKLEDTADGTDRGWVYATLTEDGKQVTSAGKLETCMGCHEDAGDDRVFGVRADMDD